MILGLYLALALFLSLLYSASSHEGSLLNKQNRKCRNHEKKVDKLNMKNKISQIKLSKISKSLGNNLCKT
jgi:hypothetical protein